MGGLNIDFDFRHHKFAIFYCLVATIGALCYGYDTIYYSGIQGMKYFIRDYGVQQPVFLGALTTAPINDRFGRRAVFLTASICIIVGAILQTCSFGNYPVFCIGRIFIGLGIGQFTTTCLVYIGEVAPAPIRGPALMMFQFMQSCSQFVGACVSEGTQGINGTASYRLPMALLIILPFLMLICLPFIPESPTWLVYKDRKEHAIKALHRINRDMPGYTPDADIHTIEEQVRLEQEALAESSWASLLKDPVERRKLFFACGAMFVQQICGIQFWYSYGVIFMQSLDIAGPFTLNVIIYVIQIVTVGMSVILGNEMRRRWNLIVCTLGMLFSLVAVGGLGTTHKGGPFSRNIGVGIVCLVFFNVVFFNFSIGTLSYTIASEMSVGRNRHKITACAIGTFFFTVWMQVFTAPYLYYTARLGPMIGFVYAAYTLCCTLPYSIFCVGETAGRTNADIERFFVDKVPVMKWRTYIINPEAGSFDVDEKMASVETYEAEGAKV